MKYCFINHGFMGNNIENWFPYVKSKVDNEKIQCIIPQYPTDEKHQFYEYWKQLLDLYLEFGLLNDESIMVGHSTGSIFSIKYILDKRIKVDKLVLVSGFNNFQAPGEDEYHTKVNASFYVSNDELKTIKKYANKIICIYGDNDPYIPQNILHSFAKDIRAQEIIIKGGGHLNASAGYTEFNKILDVIK